MKTCTASVLLAIALASMASLVSGAPYLDVVLPGALPLGNVVAALVLVSGAAASVFLSAPRSALRYTALISLAAAAAWLPVSIALAGNPGLNFSGWRGSVWLGFSLVVLVAVMCTLAWGLVGGLFSLLKRARTR